MNTQVEITLGIFIITQAKDKITQGKFNQSSITQGKYEVTQTRWPFVGLPREGIRLQTVNKVTLGAIQVFTIFGGEGGQVKVLQVITIFKGMGSNLSITVIQFLRKGTE